jgi:putative alpha-1,2-mannosidase
VLGAPQLPKAEIRLPDGKKFTVKAQNLSDKNKYVKSVKLNGVKMNTSVITYDQIMQGGVLEFEMNENNKNNKDYFLIVEP